jgi:hypothetical protein
MHGSFFHVRILKDPMESVLPSNSDCIRALGVQLDQPGTPGAPVIPEW